MVAEGKPASEFTLQSDTGDEISLESLQGKPVVPYFSPMDDTVGTNCRRGTGIVDG